MNNQEHFRISTMQKLPDIGEEVVISIVNQSAVKTGPLTASQADTLELRGKMAVKPRWDTDPNNFAMVVPLTPVVLRIININHVVAINGIALFSKQQKSERTKVQSKKYKIAGSRGNSYTVIFDGVNWTCNCPAAHFRRNCRHIKEARELNDKE